GGGGGGGGVGDWTCAFCNTNCIASKNSCRKCKAGDWTCPECNSTCFKCKAPRPGAPMPSAGKGRTFTPREGDWTCPECGGNCFASRQECFRCKSARPAGANF
ncbi:hypothetical protein T484DRAFT_1986693, partial [Baffinella frigidus]